MIDFGRIHLLFMKNSQFIFLSKRSFHPVVEDISPALPLMRRVLSLPKKVIPKNRITCLTRLFFSHNNEYYMIPETSENRTIDFI